MDLTWRSTEIFETEKSRSETSEIDHKHIQVPNIPQAQKSTNRPKRKCSIKHKTTVPDEMEDDPYEYSSEDYVPDTECDSNGDSGRDINIFF